MVACGVVAKPAVAGSLVVLGAGMFFVSMLLPVLTEFEVGLSGFKVKLRDRDAELRATVDPDAEELTQVATSLAGNPQAGKELLEQALVKTYMTWREAKQKGVADAVRGQMETLVTARGQTGRETSEAL
jgi:hypothetical protein